MSLLHISLIAGLATVTVPILLHLVGRRQPRLVDFPTLRFVRETRQEQSSSWQLRHVLLLLLRVLLLAALAFALTQPRVHSSLLASVIGIGGIGLLATLATLVAAVAFATKRTVSVWGAALAIALAMWSAAALWTLQAAGAAPKLPVATDSSPIAAALVIDNGPTLTYQANNRQRLDAAKEMANWLLEQMPLDSRVGILGGAPVGTLALDPLSAKTQVKLVEPWGARVDLLSRTRAAIDLVLANELERKEVYIITDLNATAWSGAQQGLSELLAEYREEVLVQIIDVGDDGAVNWQLGNIESDFYTVPAGGSVSFQVPIQNIAPESFDTADSRSTPVSVELWQEEYDPRLPEVVNGQLRTAPARVVDRQVLDLAANGAGSTTLTASNLPVGTHHFTIRLDQADPLQLDNERYATVVAREQQPTLIVTSDAAMGELLRLIVDPFSDPANAGLVDDIRYVQLPQAELARYKVICLYDPPPLSAQVGQRIVEHVKLGGGLLNILGSSLEGASRQQVQATFGELLPMQAASAKGNSGDPFQPITRSERAAFAVPVALTHPVFAELSVAADQVPWNLFPVFKSWSLSPLADNASVLMKLNQVDLPLLVSHSVGGGQVLTLTTPLPEPEASQTVDQWNELWIASDPWPAYGVLLGAFQTLSGADQSSSVFVAGEPVQLSNDPVRWPSRYTLFLPTQTREKRVDATAGTLPLGSYYQPGIYRLRGQRQTPVARGFSVNALAEDTSLSRINVEQLDERLGAGNYHLARDRDEVESSVGHARHGRELYSMLMLMVASLFLAEQAMSNRFYQVKFGRGTKA